MINPPFRQNITSNFMTTTTEIHDIIEKYIAGHRYFLNLDFEKGEKLTVQLLYGRNKEVYEYGMLNENIRAQ